MQTILGAGGAIGTELAKSLSKYTGNVKLVSRNPKKVNQSDILFPADITNPTLVNKAVQGSAVVYLTAGFTYKISVWKKTWPAVMDSVIEACLANNSKLVFFDNMYCYSADHLNPMTENTPYGPVSEKGKVRAAIAENLNNAVRQRGLQALIARSADFFGPGLSVSFLTETVLKPLSEGKTANVLMSDSCRHSFTYTPDAGKATALLGNTPDAYGQTWHLPTAPNPLTGKQWVEIAAGELGVKPKYRVNGKLMIQLLGLFIPAMKETVEMLYQYDRDYVFSSEKFDSRFSFTPTSYIDGLRQIVRLDYKK